MAIKRCGLKVMVRFASMIFVVCAAMGSAGAEENIPLTEARILQICSQKDHAAALLELRKRHVQIDEKDCAALAARQAAVQERVTQGSVASAREKILGAEGKLSAGFGSAFDGDSPSDGQTGPVPTRRPAAAKKPPVENYSFIFEGSVRPNGIISGLRLPSNKLKVGPRWTFVQINVPVVSRFRTGHQEKVLQSQVVQNYGLGSTVEERLVNVVPGFRAYPLAGTGVEKKIKRFVVSGRVDIGVSKNTTQELLVDEYVQTSPFGPDRVIQKRVLQAGPGVNTKSFYSDFAADLGFNIKPNLRLIGGYTRNLTGFNVAKNSAQFGIVITFQREK